MSVQLWWVVSFNLIKTLSRKVFVSYLKQFHGSFGG